MEVASDAERPWLGRFLRATRAIPAGGLILKERYLSFVSVPSGLVAGELHVELHRAVVQGECAGGGAEGTCWGRWGAGYEEIRASELDTGDEAFHKQVAQEVALVRERLGVPEEVVEDVVHLACVFGKNAFSFEGEGGRRSEVVFSVVSRATHSCAPNATIRQGDSGACDESLLVALRPILPSELIEICYMPDEYLIGSTVQRRDVIREQWSFDCRCPRCDARFDLSRRFFARCECGAADFLADHAGGLHCTGCSRVMSDKALMGRLLEGEREAEALLESLPAAEDLQLPADDSLTRIQPGVWDECRSFAATHALHRVAAEVARRSVPVLHRQRSFAAAADAQASFVRLVRRILPEGLCGLQWLAELHGRLAYLLELAGRRDEARLALEGVLDNLEVVFSNRPDAETLRSMFDDPTWWQLLRAAAKS